MVVHCVVYSVQPKLIGINLFYLPSALFYIPYCNAYVWSRYGTLHILYGEISSAEVAVPLLPRCLFNRVRREL